MKKKSQNIFESEGYAKAFRGEVKDIEICVQIDSDTVKGILHCDDPYDMSVSLVEPQHLQSSASCGHTPYFARGSVTAINVDTEGNFTQKAIARAKKELAELYKRELLFYEKKEELFQKLEAAYQEAVSKNKLSLFDLQEIVSRFMEKNKRSLWGSGFYSTPIIRKFFKKYHPKEFKKWEAMG